MEGSIQKELQAALEEFKAAKKAAHDSGMALNSSRERLRRALSDAGMELGDLNT